MKFYPTIVFILFLILTACGQAPQGSRKQEAQVYIKPNEQEHLGPQELVRDLDQAVQGQYLAVFETLNPELTSKITGAFTFSRETVIDEIVGDVRITNAGANLNHAQNVRYGRRCPTLDDDLNQDGILDAEEGELVYGKILIPLDGDLSSQSSHDGEFPVGDSFGNYIYSRVAKFSSFMEDLRANGHNQDHHKLRADEPLDIEGRVVVVHGVDEASDLPETVRTVGRPSAYQSLPIACGSIKKVLDSPGEIESE